MRSMFQQARGLRVAVGLMLVVLPSCAENGATSSTEQKTVTTTVETQSSASKEPIEIRRFGTRNDSAETTKPETPGTIYAGTGMLYTPMAKREGSGAKASEDGDVSLDFVNTDIKEVAKSILGDLLGLNYLVDASAQGTITLQTNQKIRKDQLLPAFETVLRVNGLALVQQGGFYSIVSFGNAGKAGNLGARDAGYGTEIIVLHYVGPEQMRRVLEPLIPQGTIVQVDQARNLMVIGGSEGERAAIRENIATFDVDWLKGMSFALFRPRVATAKQMTDDLLHVMGDENSPMAGQVRLIPIERMNAVLAIAPQPRYLEDLRGWVTRLDQGSDTTERRIFVYYAQNGRASDLAHVLGKALGIRTNESQSSQSGSSISSGSGARSLSSGTAQQGQSFQSSGSSLQSSQGFGGQSGTGSGMFSQSAGGGGGYYDRTGSTGASSGTSSGNQENDQPGGMSITADEVNNALLIVATSSEYGTIEAALKKLDILPLQVLIEAAIAEVTLTKDLDLGVQWKFDNGPNNAALSSGTTSAIGQSFPGFSYLYTSGTRISAVLSALQDITHVDVLSAPKLMVLNNQTATLEVGDQVPIATQSAVSTLTSGAPTVNSIEYKDTGVILTVTPRVNEGGLVLMDISQEVSDVAATTSSTLNSPTINERKIGSTVAVQDGQTIALGGLIRDNRTIGQSGVPYLQDIPLIGQAFRQNNDNKTRTELLVLITPRVVRDSRDAAAITAELRGKLLDLRDEFVPIHAATPAAH